MSWEIVSTDDIEACRALRVDVFINEQGIAPEDEWDDLDDQATHFLAQVNGQNVGTARVLYSGETGKIGRICVLKDQRGTGLGAAIVSTCIAHLKDQPGVTRAMLGAQEYVIGFYEKLGFSVCGPIYDDAGIPHRDMELSL